MPVLTGACPARLATRPTSPWRPAPAAGRRGTAPGRSARRWPCGCPGRRCAPPGGSLVAAMRRSGESSIAGGTALAATSARCVVPGAAAVRASAGAIVTSAERRGQRLDHPGAQPGRGEVGEAGALVLALGAVDVAGLAPGLVDQRLLVVAHHRCAEPGRRHAGAGRGSARRDHPAVKSVEPPPCCRTPGGRPPAAAADRRSARRVERIAAASAAVGAQASLASDGAQRAESGASRPSTSPVTEPTSSASGRLVADRSRPSGAGRASPGRRCSVVVNTHESYTGSVRAGRRRPGRIGAARVRDRWPSPARRPASNVGTRQAR